MNDDEMTAEERQAYIDTALMNLRLFLTDRAPERHALLLTHDNDSGDFQAYSFNADNATAMFMLTSAMEALHDDLIQTKINRSMN